MFKKNLGAAIRANIPAIAITTPEWERIVEEIALIAKEQEMKINTWDYLNGLMNEKDCLANPVELGSMLDEIKKHKDTINVFINFNKNFQSPVVIQKIREVIPYIKSADIGSMLIFVSTSGFIPPELEKEILTLEYFLPKKEDIEEIISSLGDFEQEELLKLTNAALGLTRNEMENIVALSLVKSNLQITSETIEEVKRQKAQTIKKLGVLELYEPENLPKVGGLDVLKLWLWEREKAFLPEAREFGLPFPKGILVFGIPGTGKSLIAKTIARQWDMPLLVMGNILDKYVGESEKKIKEALKQVEVMSPCVLMIDEIEKFFAGVGSGGDSGVSTRVFGQFLSWMQETTAPVFVVATANNVAMLPPELLRKGRFDEIFFVDLPSTKEREEIFKIHLTRKNRNVNNFDLEKLANSTPGYTGSEIEQIVISALFRAFSRGTDITTETILEVAKETPSLSITMKETIEVMRKWGTERARPASSMEEEPEKNLSAFTISRKIRVN